MSDRNEPAPNAPNADPAKAKTASPYRVFLWGALAMAAVCFWLATERLGIQRPARADAYFITGILGLLGAAMAWSLGAAHERARRTQEQLRDSLEGLRGGLRDMPRELMEESVRVAAREAEGRRADQERQARELRGALEDGIRAGFEPLAPALSARIEASLSGLGDTLRSDREERAASLRQTAETVASLRAAQEEWTRASAALLEKLRGQGESLRAGMEGRDAAAREAWDRMAADSARGLQAALDIHAEKSRHVLEALSAQWDEAVKAQVESSRAVAAAATSGLGRSAGKAEELLGGLSAAAAGIGDALESMRRAGDESAAMQAEWRATVEMFHQGMGGLLDRLQALGGYAQGQEALLLRMAETIRAFEERSAELIEDTAMRAQESLLDALDQAGSRDAAIVDDAGERA